MTLPMFPAEDNLEDRPLPELIASLEGFTLTFHDTETGRFYAIQDWIKGVAQLADNKTSGNFWRAMKRRADQLSTRCTQLGYRADNGKTYQMDHADAETLYLITQRMDSNTGLRDKILAFLAKSGVWVDEARLNPSAALEAGVTGLQSQGKDDQWIDVRTKGIVARNHYTAALTTALPHALVGWQYADATNTLYKGLWERTAAELKRELDLKPKAKLRDHQPTLALMYQMIAEETIAQKLGTRQQLNWTEAMEITRLIAEAIGRQAAETGNLLGMDIATGRPLLPDAT